MNQQTRIELRTALLAKAQLHHMQSETFSNCGNYAASIDHSGQAKGLLEAVELVEAWGRSPNNENGANDA